MRRRNKSGERKVAERRILRLHELAQTAGHAGRDEKAARYAGLARRIGMRYLVDVPATLKRRVCRGCGAYLLPGHSARVRLSPGKVSWTCLSCGRIARLPHARETRARRADARSADGRR